MQEAANQRRQAVSKRSRLRVVTGFGVLSLAVWVAIRSRLAPHGNPLGLVVLLGALAGSLPGALEGALRPGLRAPVYLALGASLGGVLALAVGAWFLHEPVSEIVPAGLIFGAGAVIIPLTAIGSGLVCFAPRREPG